MLKSKALQILGQKISGCTKCQELTELRESCGTKTVPGVGNPDAKIVFLGEAPGKNEAEQGEPFVGKAGNLLNNIIKAMKLGREDVFICNILKCRPPNNRDPKPEEAKNCRWFLDMQLKAIDPEWIVCLGRIASIHLLGRDKDATMGSMRGIHDWNGKKVICTYHPSYLLRTPSAKSDVWSDLQPLISTI